MLTDQDRSRASRHERLILGAFPLTPEWPQIKSNVFRAIRVFNESNLGYVMAAVEDGGVLFLVHNNLENKPLIINIQGRDGSGKIAQICNSARDLPKREEDYLTNPMIIRGDDSLEFTVLKLASTVVSIVVDNDPQDTDGYGLLRKITDAHPGQFPFIADILESRTK